MMGSEDGVNGALVAGVELGGTKCVLLLARGPGAIVERAGVPTRDPVATLSMIDAILRRWRSEHEVAALGVASFGPLDLDRASPGFGRVLCTPKPGWAGVDLLDAFTAAAGLPMGIDTDVGGAALAEGIWGAARGLSDYAYVTVGTGVGIGIVSGGRRVHGVGHPEAGHMHVLREPGDDWSGSCVYHGDCVEGLASGYAVGQRTGRAPHAIPPGDRVWSTVAHALAGLAHNLFMTTAPRLIIIGGGVATGQPQLFALIRAKLLDSLAGYGAAERLGPGLDRYITPPALGGDAGPLGAIALGLEALASAQVSA